MSLLDWNQDEAVEVSREEGLEQGLEQGREEGEEKSRQYFLDLLDKGLSIEEIKERLLRC